MNALSKILEALDGKKTYISVIGIAVCTALGQLGIAVPPLVLVGLKAFGATGLIHKADKFIAAAGDGGKIAETIGKAAGK